MALLLAGCFNDTGSGTAPTSETSGSSGYGRPTTASEGSTGCQDLSSCDASSESTCGTTCDESCGDIVFVAPSGDDTRPGCTPDSAMRTIQAGLLRAEERNAATVRVCAGAYDGPFEIAGPVRLLGGYSCETWERTATYGHPLFDGENATELRAGTASGPTMRIAADAAGLDGVVIDGPRGMDQSVAVEITDGAEVEFSNTRVFAGLGTVSSVGVVVDGDAQPWLHHSQFAGAAEASGFSTAVAVAPGAGAVRLEDSNIDGGHGRGDVGSVGVSLGSHGAELRGNEISGGAGVGLDGPALVATAAVAVSVMNTASDTIIEDNVIRAGRGGCESASLCIQVGSLVASPGPTQLHRNVLYGGEPTSALVQQRALFVLDAAEITVANNMLHGGSRLADGGASFTVEFNSASGRLAHNTIVSAATEADAASQPIGVVVSGGQVQIENNLLIGGSSPADLGISLSSCGGTLELGAFTGNAFAGHMLGIGRVSNADANGCVEHAPAADVSGLLDSAADVLAAAAPTEGNVLFTTDCSGVLECRETALCPGNGCPREFFDAWNGALSGTDELFDGGWTLNPSAPCDLVNGGIDSDVTQDFYARSRTTPRSIGAEEAESCDAT